MGTTCLGGRDLSSCAVYRICGNVLELDCGPVKT